MDNEVAQIDPHAVLEKLADGAVTVVDIRDPQSFAAGHPPQARHVHNENVQDFIASADKDKPLIVFCYHGYSSQSAAAFFRQQGFREVYSVRGGYSAWRNAFPDA